MLKELGAYFTRKKKIIQGITRAVEHLNKGNIVS